MVRHSQQKLGRGFERIGMVALAIVTPMLLSSVVRAQQALPPPPGFDSSLPSLTPVPPPTQGYSMPPASVSPLPQESIYQAPAPVPTLAAPTGISPQGVVPQVRTSYYQVVVPTRPENFSLVANKMMSMGVRPDAIQARKVPIGPHIAVGPFVNVGEAESVSTYLRSGGMDARVFFQK